MSRTYTQRTRKAPARRGRETGLLKLAANTKKKKKLPVTATEEHDWSSDVPSIKLTTAFFVILALHVALVTGVLVFKRFGGTVEGDGAVVVSQPPANSTQTVAQTAATSEPISQPVANLSGARYLDHLRHRVRPDESLAAIAEEYMVSVEAIRRLNGIGIDQPLYKGMSLVIPQREIRAVSPQEAPAVEPMVAEVAPSVTRQQEVRRATPTTTRSTQSAPRTAASSAKTHTVSKGETLWAISQRYGVTSDAIMKANGIKDARFLRVGAVIKIPKG